MENFVYAVPRSKNNAQNNSQPHKIVMYQYVLPFKGMFFHMDRTGTK